MLSQKELKEALDERDFVYDADRNILCYTKDGKYKVFSTDEEKMANTYAMIGICVAVFDDDWSYPVINLPTEKTEKLQKLVMELTRQRVLARIDICYDCFMTMEADNYEHPRIEEFAEFSGSPQFKERVVMTDIAEPFFSRHSCEMCGSNLGGDRYPATVLKEKI